MAESVARGSSMFVLGAVQMSYNDCRAARASAFRCVWWCCATWSRLQLEVLTRSALGSNCSRRQSAPMSTWAMPQPESARSHHAPLACPCAISSQSMSARYTDLLLKCYPPTARQCAKHELNLAPLRPTLDHTPTATRTPSSICVNTQPPFAQSPSTPTIDPIQPLK